MREKRRSLRVNYLGTGKLHHDEFKHNCRLENISGNGALVRLIREPDSPLNPGDGCTFMLHQEGKKQLYHEFAARIVRFESEVAALEFTESAIESGDLLDTLIRQELHFTNGGKKLIDLGWKFAKRKGIGLKVMYFDNGELIPEREMHTLRLSAGEHSIKVHLHRGEIEAFYARKDSEQTREKIFHAIERLSNFE
ncbi:MAG: PilZ domain-containing protein [Deltaproteobacteria bacterium]